MLKKDKKVKAWVGLVLVKISKTRQ